MPLLSRVHYADGSDTGVVAPSVWIRNARRTRAWAAVATLWSVVFACLFFIPVDAGQHRTLGDYLVLGGFYLGGAAAGLMLARRVAVAGVWIGPDEIVVAGPFRTRSLALADVLSFVPGLQGSGGNGTPCPMLQRRGGRAVGVWALGQRNIWFRYRRVCDEIQPMCDELNGLVETLRRG